MDRTTSRLDEGQNLRLSTALQPGAPPDPAQHLCEALRADLDRQHIGLDHVQALLSRIETNQQVKVIADLGVHVDDLLCEFDEIRRERDDLQFRQTSHQRQLAETLSRSNELEAALERAAQFDTERLNALQKAERSREQLQGQLGKSLSRICDLESEQAEHLSEIGDLQQQGAKLTGSIDTLRRDYFHIVDVQRQASEQHRLDTQQVTQLQAELDQLRRRTDSVEDENARLNQSLTLCKHSQKALENELAQTRRQMKQSDKLLASTQKSLDKAVEGRRKRERESAAMEKKVEERDAQISKLCASLRQLRAFFHAIEALDDADAGSNPANHRKPFQFGRILQELDKLSTSVEGL